MLSMKRFAVQVACALVVGQLLIACAGDEANKPAQAGPTAQEDEAARKAREAREAELARQRAAEVEAANRAMAVSKIDFQWTAIRFGYDSTDLNDEARAVLDQAAKYLAQNKGLELTISGHADERGTTEYNLSLGENRAKSVRKYLSQLGVSPERLKTVSFGELRPVSNGQDEAAFAQNRRAEFEVKNSSAQY